VRENMEEAMWITSIEMTGGRWIGGVSGVKILPVLARFSGLSKFMYSSVKKLRKRLAIADEFCQDKQSEGAGEVGHEWRETDPLRHVEVRKGKEDGKQRQRGTEAR